MTQAHAGLLGDTRARTYERKLQLFNAFAAPELRAVLATLGIRAGQRVMDVGCGTGEACAWLQELVGLKGVAVGIDLSDAHSHTAHTLARDVALADATRPPFAAKSFDLIWSCNTINHVREPVQTLRQLARLLRPDGRLALAQSAFLPEMYFAWDARLELEVMLACRRYYRERYGLDERDLTAIRNLIGQMRRAGFHRVRARTMVIERTAPLTADEQTYFVECVFNGYWGERVRPYLSDADWRALSALCDPNSAEFCLRRDDFHHIQTLTVVTGHLA